MTGVQTCALPICSVLEIPGVATGRGLRPITVPDLPEPIAAILRSRLASVDLLIEAAVTGSRDLAVEAMLLDGAISDPHSARALTDRLLTEQSRFLPRFS